MKKAEIIVIGAGLAGLTTAYRLKQGGKEVALFEARGRVGGRVFSVYLNGRIAELGGQNIQDGGQAINIKKLITELGLKTKKRPANFHLHYVENAHSYSLLKELRSMEWSEEELKMRLEQERARSNNMRDVLGKLFEPKSILYKACSAILASYEGASIEKLAPSNIDTLFYILTGGLAEVHQGSVEQQAQIEFESVTGGNALLAEKLAEQLQSTLFLKHALLNIRRKESGSYELTFTNGSKVETQKVVLAIPCSVMSRIDIPEKVIPKSLLEKMLQVQYGENSKVLFHTPQLEFEEAQYTNGIATTFANNCNHVVNLYLLGKQSFFSKETVRRRVLDNQDLLKKAYQITVGEEPVLAEEQNFSHYNAPVAHSWSNDPYARGSYSCEGALLGEEFKQVVNYKGVKVKSLFTPINDCIYFAGEHTSIDPAIYGTLEAAVESGERTAHLLQQV